MIKLFKRLFAQISGSTGFLKAVTTLLSGTFIALIISYAAQPILTRLYTPEAFGLFDTFVSIIALLLPFASLRYEDAIMLPEDDEEALGVLGLTFSLVVLVAAISTSLTVFKTPLANWFDEPSLALCFIWVPPTLIAVRFAKLTELWLTRQKRYSTISKGQVAQTALMAGSRIGFAKITNVMLPFGLMWGYIAGHVASASIYAHKILKTQPNFWQHIGHRESIRHAARRYKRFPRFSMPSTLLITLQSRLPIFFLLYFFDQATVGYYGRAFALFAVPLSLIGGAISQVFFVEGAIARRAHTLDKLTTKVHSRLVTIGLFPTLAIMLTGPQVMGFFLGSAWEPAGVYLQWLAPWFFLASVASPLTRLFDILEQQRKDFLTSMVIFFVQMPLFVYGCLTGDLMLALIYLAVGGILARIIHIVVLLRLSETPLRAALFPYGQQLLLSIPFLGLLYFVQGYNISWLTALTLAVSGAIFLLIVYWQLTKSTDSQSTQQ
ncbi:MAG: lipopolysaccharide biosynthesis protein [Rhodothermales bacterium]